MGLDWIRLLAPPLRRPHGRRVLLLWWGSFVDGGPTLGDVHAVVNVARWLAARNVDCHVATAHGLPLQAVPTVDPLTAAPGDYAAVAFVCGPLILNRTHRALLHRFRGARKAALGVSIVERRALLPLIYDRVVPRDDGDVVNMDLALADADRLAAAGLAERQRPALCLRGFQTEYGKEHCLSADAERIINAVSARHFVDGAALISTLITPERTAPAIDDDFRRTSVLITTRLHGGLFALVHRVPFVAVDQIRGGAKVAQVLESLRWPEVFRVDGISEAEISAAVSRLQQTGWTADMERVRSVAVERSRAMLTRCGEAVIGLLPRS